MAERTGRAEILPLHIVDTITEHRESGLYVVSANQIDEQGTVLGRRHFACRHLFLAAGSIGTTKLLVRSRAIGALSRLTSEAGRHWLNSRNTDGAFQPTTLLNAPTLAGHPLGGAIVGAACDQYGQVKRHRGLYVVDGAFIPGSTGLVNPSLTIAALAERSMEHILTRDDFKA